MAVQVYLSKSDVIDYIRNRLNRGLPVHYAAVDADASPVALAGSRKFGSWRNALRAAGVEPQQHAKWTAVSVQEIEDLVEHMRAIARQNGEKRAIMFADIPFRMSKYVARHGHSWARFAATHGLPPHKFCQRPFPNREEVIEAILALARDTRSADLLNSRPSLYRGLTRFLGSASQRVLEEIWHKREKRRTGREAQSNQQKDESEFAPL